MNSKYINAMKSLSVQAIKNAKQGHTGMAISATSLNYNLYTNFINIATEDPKWINRDRFILSAGHGSLSLYTLLHFSSILSLDEIKNYRQENSQTPGHPEYEKDNFIDASTGPLGQGLAMGIGMAFAEKYLSEKYSQLPGLIDHYTYIVVGDGDIQEGISYESMNIASLLKLNKVIVVHDSNDYQLDSSVELVNKENLKLRLESQNWFYQKCSNNQNEITKCIENAKKSKVPSYIEVKTIIGEGTTKQASHFAHGLAIDDNEMKNVNEHFNMNHDNWNFEDDIYNHFKEKVVNRGNKKYLEWKNLFNKYQKEQPELIQKMINEMEDNIDYRDILSIDKIENNQDASKTYLKHFFDQLNEKEMSNIITLSADLASTTNCKIGSGNFNTDFKSQYVMLGIREFAMSAIQNGILLHKGLKSFSGTFLSFSDYMKSSIRIGALMKLNSNYIFTHDSYLIGADGPTHQPFDQIPMLRAIENVYVLRPSSLMETKVAIESSLNSKDKVNCIILTRQGIKNNYVAKYDDILKGAYIIKDNKDADITLIATGSEVDLAIDASELIEKETNKKVKVVSCFSLKLFLEQDEEYIKNIISSKSQLVSIEASSDYMWYKLSDYTNAKFKMLGAFKFGKSMDGNKLYKDMNFNKEYLLDMIKK